MLDSVSINKIHDGCVLSCGLPDGNSVAKERRQLITN